MADNTYSLLNNPSLLHSVTESQYFNSLSWRRCFGKAGLGQSWQYPSPCLRVKNHYVTQIWPMSFKRISVETPGIYIFLDGKKLYKELPFCNCIQLHGETFPGTATAILGRWRNPVTKNKAGYSRWKSRRMSETWFMIALLSCLIIQCQKCPIVLFFRFFVVVFVFWGSFCLFFFFFS